MPKRQRPTAHLHAEEVQDSGNTTTSFHSQDQYQRDRLSGPEREGNVHLERQLSPRSLGTSLATSNFDNTFPNSWNNDSSSETPMEGSQQDRGTAHSTTTRSSSSSSSSVSAPSNFQSLGSHPHSHTLSVGGSNQGQGHVLVGTSQSTFLGPSGGSALVSPPSAFHPALTSTHGSLQPGRPDMDAQAMQRFRPSQPTQPQAAPSYEESRMDPSTRAFPPSNSAQQIQMRRSESTTSSQITEGLHTSLEIFLRFVQRFPDGTVSAEGVISPACYNEWVRTRRNKLKAPQESFRRTLTAHVTGLDGRKPFPPDVERVLLVELRKQRIWPCFQGQLVKGRPSNIGLQGFRTLGWHERRASGLEPRSSTTKRRRREKSLKNVTSHSSPSLHSRNNALGASSPGNDRRRRRRRSHKNNPSNADEDDSDSSGNSLLDVSTSQIGGNQQHNSSERKRRRKRNRKRHPGASADGQSERDRRLEEDEGLAGNFDADEESEDLNHLGSDQDREDDDDDGDEEEDNDDDDNDNDDEDSRQNADRSRNKKESTHRNGKRKKHGNSVRRRGPPQPVSAPPSQNLAISHPPQIQDSRAAVVQAAPNQAITSRWMENRTVLDLILRIFTIHVSEYAPGMNLQDPLQHPVFLLNSAAMPTTLRAQLAYNVVRSIAPHVFCACYGAVVGLNPGALHPGVVAALAQPNDPFTVQRTSWFVPPSMQQFNPNIAIANMLVCGLTLVVTGADAATMHLVGANAVGAHMSQFLDPFFFWAGLMNFAPVLYSSTASVWALLQIRPPHANTPSQAAVTRWTWQGHNLLVEMQVVSSRQ